MDDTQRDGCEMKKFMLRLHLFLVFFIPLCMSGWLLYYYTRILRCPANPHSNCPMPEPVENSATGLLIVAGVGLHILIGINFVYSHSHPPAPIKTGLEENSAIAAGVVGIIGGLGIVSSSPNSEDPGFVELGCEIPVIANFFDFCEEQLTVIFATISLGVLGLGWALLIRSRIQALRYTKHKDLN